MLAFLGMLGVPLDTSVLLDGQLQLLEGWELGIWELFQRLRSIPEAAEDEISKVARGFLTPGVAASRDLRAGQRG